MITQYYSLSLCIMLSNCLFVCLATEHLYCVRYMLKVYRGLSDHCGIPQLARKLNEVGMHHISHNKVIVKRNGILRCLCSFLSFILLLTPFVLTV